MTSRFIGAARSQKSNTFVLLVPSFYTRTRCTFVKSRTSMIFHFLKSFFPIDTHLPLYSYPPIFRAAFISLRFSLKNSSPGGAVLSHLLELFLIHSLSSAGLWSRGTSHDVQVLVAWRDRVGFVDRGLGPVTHVFASVDDDVGGAARRRGTGKVVLLPPFGPPGAAAFGHLTLSAIRQQ